MNGVNDPLLGALADLARELGREGVPLILGGGLGLFLKQRHRRDQALAGAARTLLPAHAWPPARSTEDMDLLLPTEVVADVARMRGARAALDRLGYAPVVPNLQFAKSTTRGPVKVDLLTGPPHPPALEAGLNRAKPPRVRPAGGRAGLHAYDTPEALRPEVGATPIPVAAADGGEVGVLVAGPASLMLMKLHAARDRLARGERDLAGKHALDLYRLVAMLTREEDEGAADLLRRSGSHPPVAAAAGLVEDLFGTPASAGTLAMLRQASAGGGAAAEVGPFVDTLRRLTGRT